MPGSRIRPTQSLLIVLETASMDSTKRSTVNAIAYSMIGQISVWRPPNKRRTYCGHKNQQKYSQSPAQLWCFPWRKRRKLNHRWRTFMVTGRPLIWGKVQSWFAARVTAVTFWGVAKHRNWSTRGQSECCRSSLEWDSLLCCSIGRNR